MSAMAYAWLEFQYDFTQKQMTEGYEKNEKNWGHRPPEWGENHYNGGGFGLFSYKDDKHVEDFRSNMASWPEPEDDDNLDNWEWWGE